MVASSSLVPGQLPFSVNLDRLQGPLYLIKPDFVDLLLILWDSMNASVASEWNIPTFIGVKPHPYLVLQSSRLVQIIDLDFHGHVRQFLKIPFFHTSMYIYTHIYVSHTCSRLPVEHVPWTMWQVMFWRTFHKLKRFQDKRHAWSTTHPSSKAQLLCCLLPAFWLLQRDGTLTSLKPSCSLYSGVTTSLKATICYSKVSSWQVLYLIGIHID